MLIVRLTLWCRYFDLETFICVSIAFLSYPFTIGSRQILSVATQVYETSITLACKGIIPATTRFQPPAATILATRSNAA